MLQLSRYQAGLVMQAAQGLLERPRAKPGLADARAMVERLGLVQIDTISVIQRSQYLVLWSRLGAYDASLLDKLLYPKRATFEYWAHAASIIPIADYPYFRRRMIRRRDEGPDFWGRRLDRAVVQATLARVREQGPMSSAQFEATPGATRAGRWDWYGPKESRQALEALYTMGELFVHSRRGGQKVYDLRERVLAEAFPDGVPSDDALPSEEERRHYFARRTLDALGVVVPSWVHDYYRMNMERGAPRPPGGQRKEAIAWLDGLAAQGIAVPATIEGIKEPAYVRADLAGQRLRATRTTLLSPFDSLVWHRDRARALFGYEVTFEAYVVPEKRKYGYYVLAVLHHGRIVGRVDLKSDRQAGQLRVRGLWLEPGVEADDDLFDGLAGALKDLARFVKLPAVAVERSEPPELAPRLAARV